MIFFYNDHIYCVALPMPLAVSTIVPVYNGADWLQTTITSLLSQTYQNHEVVIVDDGSEDGSIELIKSLAEHPRVSVILQANAGVAAARNAGIVAATGDLIAFCDQDDLWMEKKLEKQVPLFSDSVGLVYSGAEFRYPNRSSVSIPYGPPADFGRALQHNPICSCTAIARKDLIAQVGLLDPDRTLMGVDDWHLWLKLLNVSQAAYIPEALAIHVVHGNNYSARERAMLDASLTCLALVERDPEIEVDATQMREARTAVYRHYARNFVHYAEFDEARLCLKEVNRLNPGISEFSHKLIYELLPDEVLLRLQKLKRWFFTA